MTPRRVLVTGCSTGIGRAIAGHLAEVGHEVVASARRPDTLADLAVATRVTLDVSDDTSVTAAAAEVGPVDAIVNNAGVAVRGPLEAVPVDHAVALFQVNVFGVLRVLQAFLPGLRQRGGGTVVNVSSVAGRVALPYSGVYAASKFALEGLSEALRREVATLGVRVVVIEPGLVNTGAFEASPAYTANGYPAPSAPGGPAPSTAADVAAAVAAALADDAGPFRVPVGRDAAGLLGAQRNLDDAAFEALLAPG